ncbi:cobaltochelatase subunit CobN [Synechococcus sp. CS-1332]|uniref:cobaltochelatase subunit CobN n=1 Tax=Synechococcus sp. CS-1332 TaxID=2847972 RepID=UPI00223B5D49|nr:cobaltochelatase subunit CobN [Synechococcus sp. CS-1332]MCT0207987.1 cobaltochelatase subunit CobN [Synechococcus sp. CS-1332]
MHRLASIPGDRTEDDGALFVEQPPAPVVLLSSADTDLLAVSQLLEAEPGLLPGELRALNLAALQHPAVIDHYVATTLATTRLVVVRLLGGRGHWSYGLECLRHWASSDEARQLLVLAGTAEEEQALACLGSLEGPLATACAACLREGGAANLRLLLETLTALLAGKRPEPPRPTPAADPLPHDWRDEPGSRVGVILYRALWQAGDLAVMEALLEALRRRGLSPRALWVSSLRDGAVQRGVADLLGREHVQAVLCGTGFASVSFEEAGLGAPLWERLGVPVLQVLCSGRSRGAWDQSSIGLAPLDLSLQVALPELDGRLTTRVGAFKERTSTSDTLATALHHYEPDRERLDWIAQLTAAWVSLRLTPAPERRVALVLANYPNRNSRLANGVGLDTPASAALMLGWLAEAGYHLGAAGDLPADGDALIHRLLQGRSNDPESGHRPPLAHLPLACYQAWYATLPEEGRQRLEAVWGPPETDAGLEPALLADGGTGPAFPVRGLCFGRVLLLIQPERGYDRDPSLSYHSPDLPPTHAYLAQYLWLRQSFGAQVVVHVGKHGNLEWLPGKGLGLSQDCFPEWALGPLPHLYPFIVNDPGEGSQAKRRAQAVILDHLTPPLGRAGLHGDLQGLEALLDEYWEARQLGSARAPLLRERLGTLLEQLQLPALAQKDLEARLEAADGYLCELKEAQIRLGLHTFGTLPAPAKLAELLLCLARAPQAGVPGLTQALALDLGLDLDPWSDPEETSLSSDDRLRLAGLAQPGSTLRHAGDGVAVLEGLALDLVSAQLAGSAPGNPLPLGAATERALQHLRQALLPPLLACGEAERQALLTGLAGGRIAAGPSGAPTRGRPDLLPTGRNFYSVDLRGLPTEAAWDLGRRSAELLLQLHLQEEGDDLRSLALSVWGTATMRNGGEDIGQALALMGVRPVWDGPTRRLVDVEVIPLRLLGRPRVDVTLRISGLFRDAFPQLVGWFNRATRLVAGLPEDPEDNPLAASARLEGHGGRIYGSAPGAYGAGLQGLIDSGHWENRGDLGEAFLNWSAWRYDGDPGDGATGGAIAATADRSGLERRLAQVQVVLHNQDNREHDLLDSDDYYQFQGGLSAAAERLQGQAPALWFGDHSRSERPRMHRLEREFDKVLRSRLLNPRWIEAMQGHGYKGGFEMAASLDYLFAYDASTGRVPDWGYGAITAAWLEDGAVREFLGRSNPWALRDMAERLLEAHNRGLWEGADPQRLESLRALVLESEGLVEQR